MAGTDNRSIKVLFREWRQGDGEAGQIMAQRFADWYYAIATSRLGEDAGKGPCEAACGKFGDGVSSVSESRALIGWAHEIIQAQLAENGAERATDGDSPNAYTGNQKPKTLLCKARIALPEEVALLEACYRTGSAQDIEPLPVLKARYKVKQWLRDNCSVPFDVAPDNPVLDRAPMPLYESGRMATPEEEVNFEQWMISDLELCKDIAEFAHFAIALRGGLPSADQFQSKQEQRKAERKASTTPVGASNVAVHDDEPAGSNVAGAAAVGGGLALVAGGGVVLLLIVAVAGYFMFAG
ncbi:MAG: hypothetical protein KC656_24970 [Myxococcales bacterium]|nr:hypothetical protein [Myxococcales bacterium]MCB9670391.1 hypothetical protein [Alphaproteobacteria bacterium]